MSTVHAFPVQPSMARPEPVLSISPSLGRWEPVQRRGASRRGLWPRAQDEGGAIEGHYRGPSSAGRARRVYVIEGPAGQAWYVPRTRQLEPLVGQLRLGEVVRLAFRGLRRERGRDVRVVDVERWVFHHVSKGA